MQKLVHMGGSDLGSSRWSIAHSIAGKPVVLFTLEIAGGEIFMVSSGLWSCPGAAAWPAAPHTPAVLVQYQGADLRRAISSM